MPRRALVDEVKSSQITVTAPWRGNVRVQPTVETILDEARPANLGKGDQLIQGAAQSALIAAIVRWDLAWVQSAVARLLDSNPPDGGRAHEREMKPLAKATGR